MIIWDEKKGEHFIRVNGEERIRIKAADFRGPGTFEEKEFDIKAKVDSEITPDGYHMHCHIVSLDPLNYFVWLGSSEGEPSLEWWLMEGTQ